jgi:hypothetical protein
MYTPQCPPVRVEPLWEGLDHVEPSPEEVEAEIEAARKEGYKLICLPSLRIKIRDYSLKPPDPTTGE